MSNVHGHYVVEDGERVAIWNRGGEVNFVMGPRRLWLWNKQVQPLNLFSCNQMQYLVVRKLDGSTEHVQGPTSLFFDPVVHSSIEVKDCWTVNSSELIVVYTENETGVIRRIVRGPAVFKPEPSEWVHNFKWTGADTNNPTRKVPGALQFTKMWTIPDQLYYDVRDVRTKDDALLEVKLMIFYELINVELMLEQTSDPIGDLINACATDVVSYVSQKTYESFIRQTGELNELRTYPSTVRVAQRVGYLVTRVVCMGFLTSDTLQNMHNSAIEQRTKMKLNAETEEQEQRIADMKISRELKRNELKHKMEKEGVEHNIKVDNMRHGAVMELGELSHTGDMTSNKVKTAMIEERQKRIEEEQDRYLKKLKELNVDVDAVLAARQVHPGKTVLVKGTGSDKINLTLGSNNLI